MQFYCPSCQQVVETNPESTITTRFNQIAYKAGCPVCQTDMAVYGAPAVSVNPETMEHESISEESVLKEFAQTAV